jgi:hypothetical protein
MPAQLKPSPWDDNQNQYTCMGARRFEKAPPTMPAQLKPSPWDDNQNQYTCMGGTDFVSIYILTKSVPGGWDDED